MPPSAGACQTIDAALNPACGRASTWSSIITAIGCCRAADSETGSPVSGAGTRAGVGTGVGGVVGGAAEGDAKGCADGPGDSPGCWPGELVATAVMLGARTPAPQATMSPSATIANASTPITPRPMGLPPGRVIRATSSPNGR